MLLIFQAPSEHYTVTGQRSPLRSIYSVFLREHYFIVRQSAKYYSVGVACYCRLDYFYNQPISCDDVKNTRAES